MVYDFNVFEMEHVTVNPRFLFFTFRNYIYANKVLWILLNFDSF